MPPRACCRTPAEGSVFPSGTFVGDRPVTTGQDRHGIAHVPKAGLYRHVAALSEAGVLDVAAERRVRGAVERTFALHPGAGSNASEAVGDVAGYGAMAFSTVFIPT